MTETASARRHHVWNIATLAGRSSNSTLACDPGTCTRRLHTIIGVVGGSGAAKPKGAAADLRPSTNQHHPRPFEALLHLRRIL